MVAFEAAIDADFDEPHQRDQVRAHPRGELVQRYRRGGEISFGDRGVGDGVDRLIAGFRHPLPRA